MRQKTRFCAPPTGLTEAPVPIQIGGYRLSSVAQRKLQRVTREQRLLSPADSARLIVVAFLSTSARRSSTFVCQMVAYCCGDFPPLMADPPAFGFGGGLSRDLALSSLGADASWRLGVLVLRPAGRDGNRRSRTLPSARAGKGRRSRPGRRVASGTAPVRRGAAVLYGGCGLRLRYRRGGICDGHLGG
jgi:hypothetical protein